MRLRTGLAVLAFRFAQTRTSLRLSRPYAHQAVGVLSVIVKTGISSSFKLWCRNSPSGRFPDGKRLQSGLAVLAFRFAQTRTSLRLSRPYAHQAVGVLSVLIFNKKPRFFNLGFLLNMRREGLEPSSLAACAPQTHAYTNSATCAKIYLSRGMKRTLLLTTDIF